MTVCGESMATCINWNNKDGKGKGERERREGNVCYNSSSYSTHQFYPNPIKSSVKISTNQNIQIVRRTGARMQFDTS